MMSDEALRALGLQAPRTRKAIPGGPQDVASALDDALLRTPHAEALAGRHARYSYLQLEQAVNAASAAMVEWGIGPGDRVAACAPNHAEIVIAFLAAQRLGAVWVGINRPLAPPEKRHILNDAGVSVVLAGREVLDELRGVASETSGVRHVIEMEASDPGCAWARALAQHAGAARPPVDIDRFAPAVINYTSGTTGLPKGVVHSQHNMMVLCASARWHGRWDPDLRRGALLPLTITNNMILTPLFAFTVGAACLCMDRTDIESVAEWIERERVEIFSAVPTIIYDLLTNPAVAQRDLRVMKRVKTGGAALPGALRRLYRERFGDELQNTYGLTEAPTIVTETSPASPAPEGSSGTALPHLRIGILDDEGKILAQTTRSGVEVGVGAGMDSVGEVCIAAIDSGPWADVHVPMLGYWMQPEATAEALRGGWLHTGDLGLLDAQGNLFIKDRKKDLILRGGSNVYPAEIERVLYTDKRVQGCAVLGKPDERLGETVVAFVQPGADVDGAALVEELKALCQRELARYKMPAEWIVVDVLPRNAMGKVVKPRLAERYFSGMG